ncbi:MAG: efflux RND transporter permease subunit [Phycisphaerales bacterium]|nr:efflux RND transporter permease subunit [Phycisphaerales bacterium]
MSLPAFGVRKPVPANLLMIAMIIGGIAAAIFMRREFLPEIDPEAARIELVYPGATPQEIEESMARKVEDAVSTIDEVKRIETTVAENAGVVLVKFNEGSDVEKGVKEVERAIERLSDLPEDAERIRVIEFEPNLPVIMITLFGDADERVLKHSIRNMAEDLESLPGMGSVIVSGVRRYEVRVEVNADRLVEYGISNAQVARAIKAWMVELPSGSVRSVGGTVTVRTMGVEEDAEAIGEIVVAALPGGGAIRVRDLAEVREDFADQIIEERFNGKPGVSIAMFRTGDQDTLRIASLTKAYVAGRRGEAFNGYPWEKLLGSGNWNAWKLGHDSSEPLPAEVLLHTDLARFLDGRLNLLANNALQGAVLVFIALLLVLNLRAAWWVMVGLFTAVCGTLMAMQLFGVTLNMLTMFGLLVTLGMLTDDAIVVSENIMARFKGDTTPKQAAIEGGNQVFWPVVGTVMTTIVAFLPLGYVQGNIGKMLGELPWVVFCALLISLIESMLILPSHMAVALQGMAANSQSAFFRVADSFSAWRDRKVIQPATRFYGKLATLSVEFRWVAASMAVAILSISMGMVYGDRVPFVFLPSEDTENIIVRVRMPVGTSADQTRELVGRIEQAARAQPEVIFSSMILGQTFDFESGVTNPGSTAVAQAFIELSPVEERTRSSPDILEEIRRMAGDLSGAESITFEELDGGPAGPDITLEVTGEDEFQVDAVVEEIKSLLGEYSGLHAISDDSDDAQRELRVHLLPGAAALGLTVGDVAMQVRGALHGIEAHVFSADREDIDVRVSLGEDARQALGSIEQMWVMTPAGSAVPLREIARLEEGDGVAAVRRINRNRAVVVTAEARPGVSPETVMSFVSPQLEEVRRANPGIRISTGGRQQDLYDAMSTLPFAAGAAALMIYVILAWLFSSYLQPLAVMLAIPFGAIGVVWGHFLLGYDLTFLSLIGFVALAGIVVNNSLIFVEFFNRNRQGGMATKEALVKAGMRRFRPIVLTTATTILGLTPLMLEQSFQAQFLIPMAISITCGLASSTVLTLLLLPAILVIVDDVVDVLHWLWFGMRRSDRRAIKEAAMKMAEST